jgi:hypothetical protein
MELRRDHDTGFRRYQLTDGGGGAEGQHQGLETFPCLPRSVPPNWRHRLSFAFVTMGHLTSMGMRISMVEAIGRPLLMAGKKRHFCNADVRAALRPGSAVA